MKRLIGLSWLILITFNLYSQDEGLIERKARFERPHSLTVQIGPLFRVGKSDYNGGYSVSVAYTSRVNRILSVGPAIAFSRFAFQPSYADSYKNGSGKGNNIFQVYDEDQMELGYYVYVVNMRGGNLNQFNLGLNTRVNFAPNKVDKKVSVYLLAEPFLLFANRSKVRATTDVWSINSIPFEDPKLWDPDNKEFYEEVSPDSQGRGHWAGKVEITGGINLGFGVEVNLPTNLKLYLQPNLRYTLPISHIKTANYPALSREGYNNPKYPFAKESFASIGVLIGITYNF